MNCTQRNVGIVTFVPDLWAELWQSRHHVMRGLSAEFKVLWVSPAWYVETWRNQGVKAIGRRKGLEKVSQNLWAYAPRLPADYKRSYVKSGLVPILFRRYNVWWKKAYAARVRQLARSMGMGRIVLYIWRPEFAEYASLLPHELLCYHIDDEYGFDPDCDAPISPEETALLKKADLAFIHSKTLMAKKGHINPNTHQVPNGVDFELYRRVIEEGQPEPPDLAAIPHPRIGYMGHIKRHLDLPLLREIATSRPDWHIVMIGPVRESHEDIKDDVAALRQQPNVHFLGGKAATELPRYVNGFDVGIMPYRHTNYTKYIYPLKMHEYFACGKPVVSTRLKNIEEFADILHFAEAAEDWTAAISNALETDSADCRQARIQVAKNNSWKERVQIIQGTVNNAMLGAAITE